MLVFGVGLDLSVVGGVGLSVGVGVSLDSLALWP